MVFLLSRNPAPTSQSSANDGHSKVEACMIHLTDVARRNEPAVGCVTKRLLAQLLNSEDLRIGKKEKGRDVVVEKLRRAMYLIRLVDGTDETRKRLLLVYLSGRDADGKRLVKTDYKQLALLFQADENFDSSFEDIASRMVNKL